MTDHDAYVTGSVTRGMCVCGEPWCESDGGPCHFVCDRCGKIVANENSSDEEGLCRECADDQIRDEMLSVLEDAYKKGLGATSACEQINGIGCFCCPFENEADCKIKPVTAGIEVLKRSLKK